MIQPQGAHNYTTPYTRKTTLATTHKDAFHGEPVNVLNDSPRPAAAQLNHCWEQVTTLILGEGRPLQERPAGQHDNITQEQTRPAQ